jgi:hypothetical protein
MMQDVIRAKLIETIGAIYVDIKAANPELSLGELAIKAADEVAKGANYLVYEMKRVHEMKRGG